MSKCEGGEQLTKANFKVGMSVRLTEDKIGLGGSSKKIAAGSIGTVTELFREGKKIEKVTYDLRVNYGTAGTPDLWYEFFSCLVMTKH